MSHKAKIGAALAVMFNVALSVTPGVPFVVVLISWVATLFLALWYVAEHFFGGGEKRDAVSERIDDIHQLLVTHLKAQPIGLTLRLRVPIPNGEVVIGDLRQLGRTLTAKVEVRIERPFHEAATVFVRVNGRNSTPLVLCGADQTGRFEDVSNPFTLPLVGIENMIDISGVVKIGDKEYVGETIHLVV